MPLFAHLEKSSLDVKCLAQVLLSSPSLTTLVPVLFIFISLVFLYLSGLLFSGFLLFKVGGAVASWLVRSTPERVLRVRALAGDVVL